MRALDNMYNVVSLWTIYGGVYQTIGELVLVLLYLYSLFEYDDVDI